MSEFSKNHTDIAHILGVLIVSLFKTKGIDVRYCDRISTDFSNRKSPTMDKANIDIEELVGEVVELCDQAHIEGICAGNDAIRKELKELLGIDQIETTNS